MSSIFAFVNFFILIFLAVWLGRPVIREFFYARRVRLRREIASSLKQLGLARSRAAGSRRLFASLEKDIAERQKEIELICQREADAIREEAHRQAGYITEITKRRVTEEKTHCTDMLRLRLLERCFATAGEKLRGQATTSDHLIRQGIEGLKGAFR